jgi:tight adherence protein B
MQNHLFLLLFPLLFILTMLAGSLALRYTESEDKKKMTAVLERRGAESVTTQLRAIVVDHSGKGEMLRKILANSNLLKKMEANLQAADLNWPVWRLLAIMAGFAAAGSLLAIRFRGILPFGFAAALMACVFGMLPYLFVLHKKSSRLAAFESQFPEALDFLARSMRAGHAFVVSLEMLSKEAPDPLGIEFRRLFNEQNLGSSLDIAFSHLVKRVPLTDLRFFVSTVLLQKETGGNLAEILSKLASVIRERFKLKGQVRAASAHGRLTATILGILPIVLALGLLVVAPGYLQSMMKDPMGKYIIMGAVGGQLLGYYCMTKIIDIKV